MGRWTKKDHQRLNRATRCELCDGTMARDDRTLWWSARTGGIVAHPACTVEREERDAAKLREAAEVMARGRELVAQAAVRAAERRRLGSLGLWVP